MSEFIDISVLESIVERIQTVGMNSVTDAEREVYHVFLLQRDTLHQDISDVLRKWSSGELNHALAGLQRIGAEHAAAQLLGAMEAVSGDKLKAIQSDFARSEIADIRATSFPDKYVNANPDQFPGPRSLVELWDSMQRRGVTEKPKRLVEMERHAARDAPFTDQRCATCGQPVPKHKSKCRRCGRAYLAPPVA